MVNNEKGIYTRLPSLKCSSRACIAMKRFKYLLGLRQGLVFPFHCFHNLTKSRRIQTLAGAKFESRGIFSTIFQQPTYRNFHVRLTDGFDFPLTLLQPLGIRVYESCKDPCKDVQPVDQPRQAKCT